jgi:hypothetical protein
MGLRPHSTAHLSGEIPAQHVSIILITVFVVVSSGRNTKKVRYHENLKAFRNISEANAGVV